MGVCCSSDDQGQSSRRQHQDFRVESRQYQIEPVSEAVENNKEKNATASVSSFSVEKNTTNKINNNNNNSRHISVEPSSSPNRGGSPQGNAQKSNEEDPRQATTNFLKHVNGANSHSVARVIFEQWLVVLNSVEQDEERRKNSSENNKNINIQDQNNNNTNDADEDVDIDGFGNSNSNNSNSKKRNTSAVIDAANMNDQKESTTTTSSSALNLKSFGPGVEIVQISPSHTRITKWATQHASESVTHQSVEEIVQDFLPALQEEISARGWGGELEYNQQGYDTSGVVSVLVTLIRCEGSVSHTYEIVVEYHAVSLL